MDWWEGFTNSRDAAEKCLSLLSPLKLKTLHAIFTQKTLLIFILMPYDDGLTQIYEECIKKPLEELGHRIMLAKNFKTPSPIFEDILKFITEADVIIADLTYYNPNVFYELGRAHEKNKTVIQICHAGQAIPFDVNPIRTIIYEDSPEGCTNLTTQLLKYVEKYGRSKPELWFMTQ